MAIAFRAEAHTTYGANANSTSCNKPTGTVDNDIMVAGFFQGRATTTPSVPTAPAGWAQIGAGTTATDGAFTGRFTVWWKRASSEGSSYTWTYTGETNSTQIAIAAYSGCLASGSPIDVSSSNNVNSGATLTATGVTTTVANTMLAMLAHNWDGAGTLTPPTGMTERFDGLVYVSDKAQATAAATGNFTQTQASGNPWSVTLLALKPATVTTYTLAAAAGSYAMTGTAASTLHGWKPAAAVGSYLMTGTAATPTKLAPKTLAAAAGGYAMTGTAVSPLHGWKPAAAAGSYTMTGTAAALTKSSSGGAVPVFRAEAHIAYAGRGALTTCNKPTGTVDGDIMIATLFMGANALGDIVLNVAPSGWTQIGTPTSVGGALGFFGILWVWWKRAASEGASYDFLHDNTLATEAIIASYSGCIASGSPIDAFTQNSGTGTTTGVATATGLTASVAGTKLIYAQHNWEGSATLTPPTGMTERYDSILYLSDEDRPASGATGDRTQTLVHTDPWQAYLINLKPAPAAPSAFAPPPFNPAAFLPFLVR